LNEPARTLSLFLLNRSIDRIRSFPVCYCDPFI
jgi:hypothetical protein